MIRVHLPRGRRKDQVAAALNGVNLPGVALTVPALTEADLDNARWAAEAGADFISLSFVRSPSEVQELKELYTQGEIGDGQVKKELGQAINAMLEPMRDRRATVTDDDVMDILKAGSIKANAVAEQTLYEAKHAMNYDFHPRKISIP